MTLKKPTESLLIKSKLSLKKSNISDDNGLGRRRLGTVINLKPTRLSLVALKCGTNQREIREEVRLRIYKMIQAGVLEQYEQHLCLYNTYKLTKKYVKILLEELDSPLSIFETHNKTNNQDFWANLYWKLIKMPLIGKMFKKKLQDEVFKLYDFYSTIFFVLEEIKHNEDNNIIFRVLISKKKILKEIDREIVFFSEAIDTSFNMFSMVSVQTRKAAIIMVNF